MITVEIKKRWSSAVIYATQVECDDPAPMRTAVIRANLISNADISGADLSGADLRSAYLRGAYLSNANLRSAYLDPIRDDLRAVLDSAPAEVAGLLAKLDGGEVDGSAYQGECACLVGTIANLRGCDVSALTNGLTPDSSRPAERWFLAIGRGSTPGTNPIAAVTRDWIVEWQAERGEAVQSW